MRNWNEQAIDMATKDFLGFYSTYEELKLTQGNCLGNFLKKFLQYLWGIETSQGTEPLATQFICFYSTYEELKLSLEIKDKNRNAPFLQYLWGIETNISQMWHIQIE